MAVPVKVPQIAETRSIVLVHDAGPWRGPSEQEWVDRIGAGALRLGDWPPMPVPWMKVVPPMK